MGYAKIRPKRGTASQWEHANPVLSEGEFAVEAPEGGVGKGTSKFKIGDGVTAWNALPYAVDVVTAVNGATETINAQVSKKYEALSGQIAAKADAGDVAAANETISRVISKLEALPYIICGSKSTTGSGTSATILFSQADVISKIKSKFGDTSSAVTGLSVANVNVIVSNGDGGKQSAHVEGATCLNNNWYACWDKNITSGSAVVVNYTIIANVCRIVD